jgi:hypothetical protein
MLAKVYTLFSLPPLLLVVLGIAAALIVLVVALRKPKP